MKTIEIKYDATANALRVVPDPLKCSVSQDVAVRWKTDLDDWRVIFSCDAPVFPQVASPGSDSHTLELKGKRPRDLGHCKYTVVAMTPDGLKHLDPELIVDS